MRWVFLKASKYFFIMVVAVHSWIVSVEFFREHIGFGFASAYAVVSISIAVHSYFQYATILDDRRQRTGKPPLFDYDPNDIYRKWDY